MKGGGGLLMPVPAFSEDTILTQSIPRKNVNASAAWMIASRLARST